MKTSGKTQRKRRSSESSLMVRLDQESKVLLKKAADLRNLSVSDYVRALVIAQAQRDVQGDLSRTIHMSAEEVLDFWNSLQAPVKLTPKQEELGRIMRGEA